MNGCHRGLYACYTHVCAISHMSHWYVTRLITRNGVYDFAHGTCDVAHVCVTGTWRGVCRIWMESFDTWRNHVTHMNKSCHTYEGVTSHIRMSHVTYINKVVWHINESCHTHQQIMSCHTHQQITSCHTYQHSRATYQLKIKITGLFCKRALWKRQYSAKETYNFIDPTTDRSHPIWGVMSLRYR